MMSLQIPARSGGLRRLLLLGGADGIRRPYSTGDRRRRVIREARQEEEDEAFLRTLNFSADPENNPPPPPPPQPRRPGGAPDDSSPHAAFPTDILRRAAGKQPLPPPQQPIGESLMEKLKLGDAAATSAAGNSGERPQPEREPTKPPPPEHEAAQPEDVDEIFRKMKETGLIPNAVAMLDGLCKSGLAWLDEVCKAKGVEEAEKLVRSFQDRNFAIDEKSIREHLDKKGPFSPVIWEVIFGKKKSGRPF
ncbi:hypothetical protein OsI_02349 [Oryza sativa Indica Group]|uniref:Uncharacterized protein n=1 Tax=Oryza sativa subsp. indica TaxID=39946 RepID=B8A9Z5_ORYSI|nr:hypothetical protein OsI_02349 [Oryza sativa Indica Group]